MSNLNTTTDTEQYILNKVIDSSYFALDVIPINSLVPEAYDYVALTQDATTDTWTFKTGGAGGTTTATVVITYTDATKATINNVAKT